tara:strand:- start:5602 stop:7062 length:1461 start_codon:yes stop_codon:yes gene_type:complete
MHGRVWTLLLYAVWLTSYEVSSALTCSDNTYASSGAVLAFNPSAAGETFDRSIPTEVDMGPVQWNVLDNGGVTLVSKLKFSASPSNYERVFAATDSATAGNALFQIMRRAETEAMFFIINDGDTSCLSDDIPITNEQWLTMLFQYDAATANIMVQLDGGTKHYKDCSAVAGFLAQNRLQNVNIFGKHGGSSPHFNGAIGGFYGFNSLLTSAQASLVLDSIVVGGDDTSAPLECTPCPTDGTVVAGCSETTEPGETDCGAVSAALVSEWKFDNDFTDSQEVHPLTATGISFVDGQYGQAAILDSDNDMLRTTNDFAPLTPTSKQTYSFWVKRSEVNDKLHHVFAQSRVRSDGNEWGIYFKPAPTNTIVVYVFGDSGLESATQFADTSTWIHFIVTVDEGVFSLYQNGNLEGTKTMWIDNINGPLYFTPDSILGSRGYFPRNAIDNFRFYNAVLSGSEVTACETTEPGETDCNTVSVSYWSIKKSTCP